MKTYLLSAVVLASSALLITSCDDEKGDGPPVIPPAVIKTISMDYLGDGTEVEEWEFLYDDQDRVETINITYNGASDGSREYDWSVPGQLTVTRNGASPLLFILDSEGRVSREMGDDGDDETYYLYEYNADGILSKIYERWDNVNHLKFEMTIEDKNVVHRIRYEDDGVTVIEDREFTYNTGDNASQIHQIYAVDSEWKWVGGVYGTQSEKLVASFLRHLTDDPTSTYGATFDYTFDADNRVSGVTKNGTSSGGNYTEKWQYTYYED